MEVIKTNIDGLLVLEPQIFEDSRGYFFESFNKNNLENALGYSVNFVQDNQSYSKFGVLRGIHFQKGKHAQAKLVRVLKGEVLDVAVDLRPESDTYGNYFSVMLSSKNKKQLFIPRGFGHGFVVLSETAEFFYKCDNFYNKSSEDGIIYNDPDLNINWQVAESDIILSEKDLSLNHLVNQ